MRPSYGDFILEQERKERRKRRMVILTVVLVLVLIIAGVGVALFLKNGGFQFDFKSLFPAKEVVETVDTPEKDVYYTQEELDAIVAKAEEAAHKEASVEALAGIKQHLAEGKTAVEAFRAVYTDDLVIAADGRYHFIPIRDDLAHNEYKEENQSFYKNCSSWRR